MKVKMKSTILLVVMMIFSFLPGTSQKNSSTYMVKGLKKSIRIDGNWNKRQWCSVKTIELTNYMGQIPPFRPTVHAKMMYDEDNLYVIFRVNDCYVRSIIEEYNGPVSTDACVEFFFSPDTSLPEPGNCNTNNLDDQ